MHLIQRTAHTNVLRALSSEQKDDPGEGYTIIRYLSQRCGAGGPRGQLLPELIGSRGDHGQALSEMGPARISSVADLRQRVATVLQVRLVTSNQFLQSIR